MNCIMQKSQPHQDFVKNRLQEVNQELISYGTYKIDTWTEIIDTVRNLNNKTTAVEKKCPYHDLRQSKHHR